MGAGFTGNLGDVFAKPQTYALGPFVENVRAACQARQGSSSSNDSCGSKGSGGGNSGSRSTYSSDGCASNGTLWQLAVGYAAGCFRSD